MSAIGVGLMNFLHPNNGLGWQVRVMPECWFVLLRFWLRVDSVLVRLYETRYMADFRASSEQPQLTREVRCCEGTFDALHAAGAPPDGVTSLLLFQHF